MKRWYLYPFSPVYGFITSTRNLFFNIGLLHSKKFRTPIIGVGNLSVGGTGKSPIVMYLADLLSKERLRTAVLSRGYGRKSKGYRVTNYSSNYLNVGDEAMQLFQRLKNRIVIAVSEDRVFGAQKVIKEMDLDVLVLDDSFQHRYINPGFNILLTEYSDPYFKDYLLPSGNLRESRSGARRANMIVVTKCPDNLTEEHKKKFIGQLKARPSQKVFFSSILYDDKVFSKNSSLPVNNLNYYDILLITGIAHPKPMLAHLKRYAKKIVHLEFNDHYAFTKEDLNNIEHNYKKLGEYKIILTTEKDFVRLQGFDDLCENLFYWPININIEKKVEFKKIILSYVGKN